MDQRHIILGIAGQGTELSISEPERRNHIYITGKSGTGKSSLLFNLAHADMAAGAGFLFLDPHGDTAMRLADSAPLWRRHDVVYFDPLDETHVVGFNPLMTVPPLHRGTLAARVVEAFRNIWAESWGPRLDYILTLAIRLLLENPGTSLVDIPRLLTDDRFRKRLLIRCGDSHVRDFWEREFEAMGDRLRAEAIAPVLNKVGQFAMNPILRAIVGGQSTIDIPSILDEGGVLICNLSKRMGEEPSHLLGSLLVTAFTQAAEALADRPEHERRDFALYVDEFQNYATTSFATVLSEARKYRLSLVAANQFLGQVPDILKYAIIGNVGTMVVFRVGAFDAPVLAKELGLPEQALIDLPNFRARVKRIHGGHPTEAILVHTLLPHPETEGRLPAVIACSRNRHGRKRTTQSPVRP